MMYRLFLIAGLLALVFTACAPAAAPAEAAPMLTVTDGSAQKTFTVDDLKALGAQEVAAKDVTYVGVKLSDLITAAGFDPAALAAVKATASDGFSANYEPAQFTAADTLVAYAVAGGALTAEDGTFRMVLPNEGGKLNVRMLTTITVIK
jgi:hypothetical protein